jgi:hypothetical protein
LVVDANSALTPPSGVILRVVAIKIGMISPVVGPVMAAAWPENRSPPLEQAASPSNANAETSILIALPDRGEAEQVIILKSMDCNETERYPSIVTRMGRLISF